jgi:hypothetical protein
MAEQAGLYVLDRKRLAQQRIVKQIYLADREVVGRTPVGVKRTQILARERPR